MMARVCVLLLWLLALAGGAHASTWGTTRQAVSTVSGGGGALIASPSALTSSIIASRTFTPAGAAWDGGVVMRELLDKPFRPIGQFLTESGPLAVQGSRVITAQALGRALARSLPVVGTALAVADLLDAIDCKVNLGLPHCDVGFSEIPYSNPDYLYSVNEMGKWYLTTVQALDVFKHGADQGCTDATHHCSHNVSGCAPFLGGAVSTVCQVEITGEYLTTCQGVPCWQPGAQQSTQWTLKRSLNQPTVTTCTGELIDGGCWREVTPQELEDKILADPVAKSRLPYVASPMDASGIPMDTEPPQDLSGPQALPGGREQTTHNPDGSTTIRDRDIGLEYPPTTGPDGQSPAIIVRETVKETVIPAGEPVPPYVAPDPGQPPSTNPPPGGGTTTIIERTPIEVKVETCGLPGKPPCKIDESGTPSWEGGDGNAEGLFASIFSCVTAPIACVQALPDLNWTFALPSGCSAIPVPAFAPFITELNICPWQPVIHDIMSMAWAAVGIFGAVGMVSRFSAGG